MLFFFFFFKQKTAYEMRISDWSSDVCSSDLQDFERRIVAGKKGLADDRRQRAVDEEIIPFEDRARRRGGDDHANVFRARLINHGFAHKSDTPPSAVRPELVEGPFFFRRCKTRTTIRQAQVERC